MAGSRCTQRPSTHPLREPAPRRTTKLPARATGDRFCEPNAWVIPLGADPPGFQVSLDRPQRFLTQDALERRHVDATFTGAAATDRLDEVRLEIPQTARARLILHVETLGIELAQIGRDPARDGFQ